MKQIRNYFERYLGHPEALGLLVIFFISFLFLKYCPSVFTPLLLSVMFSYFGSILVNRLVQWKVPRVLGVLIVFGLLMGLLVCFLFWLLPLLWGELRNFLLLVPSLFENLTAYLLGLQQHFPGVISVEQIELVTHQLSSGITLLFKPILSFSFSSILGLATIVVYLVMVPLLVFFLLRDEQEVKDWFAQFLPSKPLILAKIWQEFRFKLQIYIKGKVILSLLTGVVSSFVFQGLGLRYSVLLGFTVGLSAFIPYVGLVLVTILIMIIGLFQWGFTRPFWYVLSAHAVINFLEANVLEPIFFAELMQLSPLAIVFAVLIFGSLFGFWGIFLAIPLLSLFHILLKYWPVKGIDDQIKNEQGD